MLTFDSHLSMINIFDMMSKKISVISSFQLRAHCHPHSPEDDYWSRPTLFYHSSISPFFISSTSPLHLLISSSFLAFLFSPLLELKPWSTHAGISVRRIQAIQPSDNRIYKSFPLRGASPDSPLLNHPAPSQDDQVIPNCWLEGNQERTRNEAHLSPLRV